MIFDINNNLHTNSFSSYKISLAINVTCKKRHKEDKWRTPKFSHILRNFRAKFNDVANAVNDV